LNGVHAAEEQWCLVRGVVEGLHEELVPSQPGAMAPLATSGGDMGSPNGALGAIQGRVTLWRSSWRRASSVRASPNPSAMSTDDATLSWTRRRK
jgi:hypothetical protein